MADSFKILDFLKLLYSKKKREKFVFVFYKCKIKNKNFSYNKQSLINLGTK